MNDKTMGKVKELIKEIAEDIKAEEVFKPTEAPILAPIFGALDYPECTRSGQVSMSGQAAKEYTVVDQTEEFYIVEGEDHKTVVIRKDNSEVLTIRGWVN
jgi:hypothetical protein